MSVRAPRPLPLLLAVAIPAGLAACGGSAVTPSPSGPAPATPSTAPSGPPSPSAPADGSVVVTIRVADEEYRVRLTEADDIAVARDLLADREGPKIPNGKVIRGEADVNTGWTWHIDPSNFEWVDMTIELCDGRPSFVEKGDVSGDRFCPWSAEVVDIAG